MHRLFMSAVFLLVYFAASTSMAYNFPYREVYPEVSIIEPAALKTGCDNGEFVVVDVRSPAEFNTIHVKNAVNLPYSNAKFSQNLKQLGKENPNKKIAVYCNGITCLKCYKAAEDALYEGLTNVYAFDAGIKNWAKTYPAATIFNGKELSDPENFRHTEGKFNQACLDYETFRSKSGNTNAVVIDARDPIQRTRPLPGMEKALQIPLDKLVNNIVKKGNLKDKELFIFDQVGKQVNWLMFYLEENGYTNYYFLDGGATAVLKVQEYR